MRSRQIVREIALALLVAGIMAASPITGVEWGPASIAGLAVGGALLWYRLRGGVSEDDDSDPDVRWPAMAILSPLAYALVFSPTLLWLWKQWTSSVWSNNHGIFMPLLIGYLAVQSLSVDRSREPESSPLGYVWIGAALGMLLLDALLATRYLSVLAFVTGLPGLSLLLLGRRRTRLLAVPLAIGTLMVPIPNAVATDLYLRHMTATLAEPIVRLLGYAVYREDTVIFLSNNTFVVSDACSGFNTLYASLATGIVLACYARPGGRKLGILALAPVLALLANTFRVTMLILLTTWMGDWVIDSPIHPGSGVVAFVVVLFVLLGLSGLRQPAKRSTA